MKTIPARLLLDSVSVETCIGVGAYGPIFAVAATVLCKISNTRQLVRNSNGEEVVSEMTLYASPADESKFLPETRVTFATRTSTVLGVSPQGRPGETVLVKVTCT
jgi:hypothetical protein